MWRIGTCEYDLSTFNHPGGLEVIQRCKDTDCTELFESHHLNLRRALATIRKYRVSGNDTESQCSFYSVLRDRVHMLLGRNTGPTWNCVVVFWCCLGLFAGSWMMSITDGSLPWCISTGLLGAVIGAFGHNWVHQPRYRRWAVVSLDTVGLSSYDWVKDHNMLHHMYTNTAQDPHLDGTEPFFRTNPARKRTFIHKLTAYIFPIVLSFGIFVNYIIHFSEVLQGIKPLRPEKFIFIFQFGAMVASHGLYGALWRMYIIFGCISVWYFTLALMNHNTDSSVNVKRRETGRDWGEKQLYSCSDFGTGASFLGSVPYLWLNFHTVHHLFPSVDMSHHPAIQTILVKTAREFGVRYDTIPVCTALSQMVNNFANTPRRCE